MQKTPADSESPTSQVQVATVRFGDVSGRPMAARHSLGRTAKMKCIYKGYYLVAMSSGTENGMFQARVAAMVLSDGRTHSQRFLDFDTFRCKEEADGFAIEAGKAWVDQQLREQPGRSATNFAAY